MKGSVSTIRLMKRNLTERVRENQWESRVVSPFRRLPRDVEQCLGSNDECWTSCILLGAINVKKV